MGHLPTERKDASEIKTLFQSIGTKNPDERDLCDMLLFYTILVEHDFPTKKDQMLHCVVDYWHNASETWSRLFQYFGLYQQEYTGQLLANVIKIGSMKRKKEMGKILYQLGWIEGLDTTDKDDILLEVLGNVDGITEPILNTFLVNRNILREDWRPFFKDDFDLYRPYYGV